MLFMHLARYRYVIQYSLLYECLMRQGQRDGGGVHDDDSRGLEAFYHVSLDINPPSIASCQL